MLHVVVDQQIPLLRPRLVGNGRASLRALRAVPLDDVLARVGELRGDVHAQRRKEDRALRGGGQTSDEVARAIRIARIAFQMARLVAQGDLLAALLRERAVVARRVACADVGRDARAEEGRFAVFSIFSKPVLWNTQITRKSVVV